MPYINVPVRIGFDMVINHAALSERIHSVRAAWYKTTYINVSNIKLMLRTN